MAMREKMMEWVAKYNPKAVQWIKPCESMSDDNVVRTMCIKMADDLENGKIDNLEFTASLSNLTGKTLEEIEEILAKNATKETTADNPTDPGHD